MKNSNKLQSIVAAISTARMLLEPVRVQPFSQHCGYYRVQQVTVQQHAIPLTEECRKLNRGSCLFLSTKQWNTPAHVWCVSAHVPIDLSPKPMSLQS